MEDDKKTDLDDVDKNGVPLYELEWAQSTSAHGFARVTAPRSTPFQRFIWICAIVACFIYVAIQINAAITRFRLRETTTEYVKKHSKFIEFPSVTVCNFNRWRASKMTDEARAELTSRISLYSYDYVIPELSDDDDDGPIVPSSVNLEDLLPDLPDPVPTGSTVPLSTTTAKPITCDLPLDFPNGMRYVVADESYRYKNTSSVNVGGQLIYRCTDPEKEARDGDVLVCTTEGRFLGDIPLCIRTASIGIRFAVSNLASDTNSTAISNTVSQSVRYLDDVTLCFWIKVPVNAQLGTILSYGVNGNETIFSVIVGQKLTSYISVKYTLFNQEGQTVTYARYGIWNPYCVQYSAISRNSLIFKYRSYDPFGFEVTGSDSVQHRRRFPMFGQFVYFNDYVIAATARRSGRGITAPSTGGEVANVNVWDRLISVEIMDNMLWEGNIFASENSVLEYTLGTLQRNEYVFNVSVEGPPRQLTYSNGDARTARKKRQAEDDFSLTTQDPISTQEIVTPTDVWITSTGLPANITTDMWPSLTGDSNSTTQDPISNTTGHNSTDSDLHNLKNVFDYATFTKYAGWQLVDGSSGHNTTEPHTLLACTYRGQTCDSKWFTHRFGAYGNCYTFNDNSMNLTGHLDDEDVNQPLKQDNAGPEGGLNLLLDIQTWEYTENDALLGNSELGLKFIVHSPYEVPVINSQGYAVGPGKKAFGGFGKTTINNLGPPYGDCVNKTLDYFSNYSIGGCALECKLARVVQRCDCRPYYFPGNFPICDFDSLKDCAFLEIAKINADFTNLCDCPIACVIEEFDMKLSYATFPNEPYAEDLSENVNISLPRTVPPYSSKLAYIRSNVINMDLYFESMSETYLNQKKAMDENMLLGDIGGQLGLFIGCSMLTAFEFFECVVMSIYYHALRSRKRKERKRAALDIKNQTIELPNGFPPPPEEMTELGPVSTQNGSESTHSQNPNNQASYHHFSHLNNNSRPLGMPPV